MSLPIRYQKIEAGERDDSRQQADAARKDKGDSRIQQFPASRGTNDVRPGSTGQLAGKPPVIFAELEGKDARSVRP